MVREPGGGRVSRAVAVARAIVHETRAEKLPFMAGSIAYHAFVSLLPLFVLLLVVVSAVGDQSLYESVVAAAGAVLTEGARDEFVSELTDAARSTSVSLFGGIVLLWGTLRIFRGLDTAFSSIYESGAENSFLDQLADGLLVLFSFGAAVLVGSTVGDAVAGVVAGAGPFEWVLARLFGILGLALAFYPMYYVFPDADVGVLEVLPGTLVAAVGLAAFESLFRVYLAVSTTAPNSSAITGVLVFLTWLYFSGFVILLGAVVNAVLSNRSHDVNIEPAFGGVAPVGNDGVHASRRELVAAVRRLDELLDGGDAVVVTADGESIELPPPDGVAVDTETSSVLPGGPVGVELRWYPADGENDSEEA
ncbi:YhjD/YihY/BrkB family envelope integrity protein [Halopelagius longus]|uniref:Membrane protein n=1 Tax=Halopelagius longus TaxID=1236180 RepID=A0A1H0YFL4_9EURY|nr:YhjD/YihY/BrkB family envelope integrity protein [Halopelagius longus]RDI72467.1 YihY/virulence factor BrkB family protein [Halopelagius longus]SDQ14054.1 membrane protein [Halopelagius longus]